MSDESPLFRNVYGIFVCSISDEFQFDLNDLKIHLFELWAQVVITIIPAKINTPPSEDTLAEDEGKGFIFRSILGNHMFPMDMSILPSLSFYILV